jgi:hypothetical protein
MDVRRVSPTIGAAVTAVLLALGGAAVPRASVVISPELLQAAAARGSVRVMVQLKVTEGADAAAIGAAKQALWSDLRGTTYRVIRDLPGFPAVVLDVSPPALEALAVSPAVGHVAPDEARRPQR